MSAAQILLAEPQRLLWLRLTGVAGLVGALMWTVGDALLIGGNTQPAEHAELFGVYADRVDLDKAAMMVSSSQARLAAGVLVANAGVVFYLVGSWHLFQGLRPAGARWAWPIFLLLLFGNAWAPLGHAGYYYLGMVYKTLSSAPPAGHRDLLELGGHFHQLLQIAWLMPIATLGLALLGLGTRIALGHTAWPRWFALLVNPLGLVAIGTVIAGLSPEPLATWLQGAAFNLGLLTVYATSTALLWNGGRRSA